MADASGKKLTPAEFLQMLRADKTTPSPAPVVEPPPVEEEELEDELPDAPPAALEAKSDYAKAGRGGVVLKDKSGSKDKEKSDPEALVRGNKQLQELFERVNSLLGDAKGEAGSFKPKVPESLEEAGLNGEEVEKLVLKYLLQKGASTGRNISAQIKLPFGLLLPMLKQWKHDQLVSYKASGEMGDYTFAITDFGRERARRYTDECSYYGAAPVCLPDYLRAMSAQTIAGLEASEEDLKDAFKDLLVSQAMVEKLGPAINSGRGMFLFGEAGNGKTSIAERITRCFGDSVWIPRTLGIDGDIIRLFDPGVHEELPMTQDEEDGLFDRSGVDPRWVRITRPTIVAGGELTMAELEVTQNPMTKICEAPLQLKSNCGTLVIDDFGRQQMPTTVLLNRWIVPLEKRYDYLNLPSGKKIQVPFDQLIIFSTNLEPADLVDGAFLRRIPYKICVPDPSEEHFKKLFHIMAPKLGLVVEDEQIDYLIKTHYVPRQRAFRNCQPRDLLLQVRNFCTFKRQPKKVTNESFDYAVENYFSMM